MGLSNSLDSRVRIYGLDFGGQVHVIGGIANTSAGVRVATKSNPRRGVASPGEWIEISSCSEIPSIAPDRIPVSTLIVTLRPTLARMPAKRVFDSYCV